MSTKKQIIKDVLDNNYNIGYKQGYSKAIEEFERMIERISDLNFTKPIKRRLIEEVDKLKDGKRKQ